jgi:hypothetical protein
MNPMEHRDALLLLAVGFGLYALALWLYLRAPHHER